MSINNRIKEVRNKMDLTQVQFANKITVSSSYFAGIELGHKNINERIIRLITNEFGISEHWLKTGQGEMFINNENSLTIQMMSIFKSLNPQLQQCALKLLKALDELTK